MLPPGVSEGATLERAKVKGYSVSFGTTKSEDRSVGGGDAVWRTISDVDNVFV